MAEKYLYNQKQNRLHIKGYCPHTKGIAPKYYIPFDTENEALAYDGRAVSLCKLCLKTRERKLEENTK